MIVLSGQDHGCLRLKPYLQKFETFGEDLLPSLENPIPIPIVHTSVGKGVKQFDSNKNLVYCDAIDDYPEAALV